MPYSIGVISRLDAATKQVEDLIAVHKYLERGSPKEVSDHILRAALTMIVSSIDTCVHELLVAAIMYELRENKGVFKISEIKVDIGISQVNNNNIRLNRIESSLRRQYSNLSYQSSRNIELALSSIGINRIWQKLSGKLLKNPEHIKKNIDLIARRRNQIVHEGDLDYLHNPQEINASDIEESLSFIKNVAEGIIYIFKDMTASNQEWGVTDPV